MHDYVLLPGAGRLLKRRTRHFISRHDNVPVDDVRDADNMYVRTLAATVRLGNEGQKASPTISTGSPYERSYVHPLPW
jgi:hypothetical protein